MVNVIISVLCRDVARRVSTDSRHDMTAVQIHSVPAEWICKNNQNHNTECRPWRKKNLPCFQVVCYFPIFPKSTENATEQVVPVVKGELL